MVQKTADMVELFSVQRAGLLMKHRLQKLTWEEEKEER